MPRARLLATTALVAGAAWTMLAPAAAQELRIGLQQVQNEFDPGDETGNDGAPALYNVFDTLIERKPFTSPLEFEPGLATSWELVEPNVMELRLREGVVMHDGTTMDAEDVAFSLNRIFEQRQPEFGSADGRFFYNFERVEVVDPLTVRVHAERPDPLFETLLSARNAGIVSEEYVEEVGFDGSNLMPRGTGPYRVAEYQPRERIVLERHEEFWGEPAPFERVIYREISEPAARVTALVNDEVDLITNLPPNQMEVLQGEDGVTVKGITWPMFHVWVLNMNHPAMDDPKVRKAMRLAIDREALVEGLWDGKAIAPKAHQYPEYGEPLYMPDLELIEHDPARAEELLAESTYDGETIRVTYEPYYYLYMGLAAQAIEDMWQQIGLNVELAQVDDYDYDNIMIRPWSNPMYYPDPMGAMDTHWSTNSWTYERGLWDPQNPDWSETYERVRFSTDPMERRDAYRELLEIAEEESGWILLYRPHEGYAMRADLEWEIPVALRPYTLPLRAGQAGFSSE